MSHYKKLEEKELAARAKVLYFDKNPKIIKIYCDEFGRFAYRKQDLLEVNKNTDVKIFEINSKGLKADAESVAKVKESTKPKKEEEKKK